ncbi:hypothetical protein TVAG_003450 [Trichomonas vaginalis G3]|uniref:Uncharacterized protein n=1 Tax=Trichomonas vaginalis (strain ATCC PRA-98 / G3) TaxID=412133 RepID=A2HCX3_TRIV3|nr:hypothetical protein TVAGG3_0918770 [Trichomonas vaginalis G3]EAX72743.1 hypothetical protein TVAG_003450 [Trichomonas vaginalis G3]KAI5484997.1 hypothetical protein TVAGG3_0918770 [Trichomonas vaginalis G3]|eukprot:XP_001285673.1 hypothetical protein [Trichomonas vaginalis G3]
MRKFWHIRRIHTVSNQLQPIIRRQYKKLPDPIYQPPPDNSILETEEKPKEI